MNPTSFEDIESARLRLSWMSPRFIEASLHGHTEEASALIDAILPAKWPEADTKRRLEMRLAQMQQAPESAEWLLRAIVRLEDRRTVGVINFHGPPDEMGRAELGYMIFEEYRRRGYASEGARAMMSSAHTTHGTENFVVSISPKNEPSLRLAESMGFRRIGTQIDDIDGEEWVFEMKLRPREQ